MTKTYIPELYTFTLECTQDTVLAVEHLLDVYHMEHHRVASKPIDDSFEDIVLVYDAESKRLVPARNTIIVEYKASIYENIALEKPLDKIFG